MNNYKLRPVAITKLVVVILIMAIGVMMAVKNGGTTQADKYAMLGGGAIVIAFGTVFCTVKVAAFGTIIPGFLYFFGTIFFPVGSFGMTTYALSGPNDFLFVALPGSQFLLIDLITMQLALVITIMLLVVMRIGKHFLWDDRVLTDELY